MDWWTLGRNKVRVNTQKYDSILPDSGAIAQNAAEFLLCFPG